MYVSGWISRYIFYFPGSIGELTLKKDFNLIATAIPVITTQFASIHDVGWYGAAFYIVL